jgi:hypothetical protein
MLRAFNRVATVLICVLGIRSHLGAQQVPATAHTPSIEERTSSMQKLDGYFPIYWERLAEFLPGWDRTTSDWIADRAVEARWSRFQRVGPKVLLVQGNESFRSSSANPAERRSVEDSFAKSILWGFTVAAETNGHVLVDATDFFVRDGRARQRALGGALIKVDRTRSAVYMERTKAFPKNTEIEVTLTFTQ